MFNGKEWLGLAARLGIILGSGLTVVLNLSYLGLEGQGEVAVINFGILLFVQLSQFIGGGATAYFITRREPGKLAAASFYWIVVLIALALLILGLFHFFLLPSDFRLPSHLILLTIGLGALQALFTAGHNFLLGQNKTQTYHAIILFQALFSPLAIGVNYQVGAASILDFIVGLYVAFILTLAITLYTNRNLLRIQLLHFDLAVFKELFQYGKFVQGANLLQLFNQRFALAVLSSLPGIGLTMAGLYSLVLYALETLWSIAKSLSTVQYAIICNEHDMKKNWKTTSTNLRRALLYTAMAMGVYWVIPASWFKLILKDDTTVVLENVNIMLPIALFHTTTIILTHLYSGTRNFRFNFISALCGSALTLPLIYWLVPNYSLAGALTATAVGLCAQALSQLTLIPSWKKLYQLH